LPDKLIIVLESHEVFQQEINASANKNYSGQLALPTANLQRSPSQLHPTTLSLPSQLRSPHSASIMAGHLQL